jgi:coenzyme Q-binding protein COQ10
MTTPDNSHLPRQSLMPTHAETRIMPHSAAQMYALIADVGSYPQFLPWCSATRMRGRQPLPDGSGEVMEADLVVSFKLFRERFGSRVTLRPEARTIDVEYLDGPFKYLNNHWKFAPVGPDKCEVDFFVDFEMRSTLLQKVIGVVFNEAKQRIVRAFEKRAGDLYGRPRA